jgi:hypothetical protein
MSDRQPLRVGLAGAGMISLYHLRGMETDRLDNLQTLELMEACYRKAGIEV